MTNNSYLDALSAKLVEALEMVKTSMLPIQNEGIRSLLRKAIIINRTKPEHTVGGIRGANEVPFTVVIPVDYGQSFNLDLSATWIAETSIEAMIPHIVQAVTTWNIAPHNR